MSEKAGLGRRALTALGTAGPAIGPLVLALTGMMFLAGWTERDFLLRRFGLSGAMFSESFQVTLARGYVPLLLGLIITALLVALLWGLAKLEDIFWRKVVLPRLPNRRPRRTFAKALEGASSIGRPSVLVTLALVTLTFAGISGGAAGVVRYRNVVAAVASGCRTDCFAYRLADRSLAGIVVVQDAERTALLTQAGLMLVETPKILSVRPYAP